MKVARDKLGSDAAWEDMGRPAWLRRLIELNMDEAGDSGTDDYDLVIILDLEI